MSIRFRDFNLPSHDLLVRLINNQENETFTPEEVVFGTPVAKTTGTWDTETPFDSTRFGHLMNQSRVCYNRLDLGVLLAGFNVTVPHESYVNAAALLQFINTPYGLNIQAADIVNEYVAWDSNEHFTLRAHASSLLWKGSIVITRAPEAVVGKPIIGDVFSNTDINELFPLAWIGTAGQKLVFLGENENGNGETVWYDGADLVVENGDAELDFFVGGTVGSLYPNPILEPGIELGAILFVGPTSGLYNNPENDNRFLVYLASGEYTDLPQTLVINGVGFAATGKHEGYAAIEYNTRYSNGFDTNLVFDFSGTKLTNQQVNLLPLVTSAVESGNE